MVAIRLEYVKKDNSNIRKYSDTLWRALRKERFKKASPDVFVNEMAAEEVVRLQDPCSNFNNDMKFFMDNYLTDLEAEVFSLFLYGGNLRQQDIAELLTRRKTTKDPAGCLVEIPYSQVDIHHILKTVLEEVKKFYYSDINIKKDKPVYNTTTQVVVDGLEDTVDE